MTTDIQKYLEEPRTAYFSMEIGLNDNIHTYSGGLGILAGDMLRASADLKLPLVAITLASKRGYFRQELTSEGDQLEHPQEWNPSDFMTALPKNVKVKIQNTDVEIRAWLYKVTSITGGEIPVLFLDTDIEENTIEFRDITSSLYGGDEKYRLKQEIVLGIGGVRILDALGFNIRRFHMNEGHSSLLALELLRKLGLNQEKVRNLCVFTTHTPVEAGHDKFSYNIVNEILGEFVPFDTLKNIGGQNHLNLTRLALNLSKYVNGVAKKHGDISNEMFPGYNIQAITNGIHSYTWTCESFRNLYDKYLPGWAIEPSRLARVDIIPDEELWSAHRKAKNSFIDYINEKTKRGFDYDLLTIGFARRSTEYKRSTLIFSDLQKLKKINSKTKFQMVFGGKAHPRDEYGKKLIKNIFDYSKQLKDEINVAYLEDYDISVASKMIPGVDVWLNTPLPPYEASGTSGMKASHNGVLNFSVLDGWWIEGCIEDVTGWSIGPDPDEKNLTNEDRRIIELDDLYNKLEYIIAPMFYQKRDEWIEMMKNSIGELAYYFNSHRMILRYIVEAYF